MRGTSATVALALLATASCTSGASDGPITVSLITPAKDSDIRATPLVVDATAQGLVAFDAEGQIEPALAERWIVTDDGINIIFRIRRAKWIDGRPVNSAEVAQSLQAKMAANSKNRLKPLLGAIAKITPMTGQVLEIRLRAPQPDFLQLLAQPDMAIIRVAGGVGTGPYQIHSKRNDVTRLRMIRPDDEVIEPEVQQRTDIRIRREPASLAIARFAGREIGLVTGGGFTSLPLVRPAAIATSQFSMDAAYGLFGLAASAKSKAMASVNVRRALAMAIDRERLVGLFGLNNWRAQYAVLPSQLDSSSPPAALEWVALTQSARIARARSYLANAGDVPVLRIALPPGPGARLLFAAIAADWRQIGVSAVLVAMDEPADLRLIDEVAPQRPALWYLERLSCARGLPCSEKTEAAIAAAMSAATLEDRSAAIAEADAAIASEQPFIPLALPLRWSLVSPQMIAWRPNAFAIHPLRHLRGTR
jgi:oligopeptide transport system substrate-binding protein